MGERSRVGGSGLLGGGLAVMVALLTAVAAEPAPASGAGGLASERSASELPRTETGCRRIEPLAIAESLAGLVAACGTPLAGADGVDLWPVASDHGGAPGAAPREGELVAVVRVAADWRDLRGEPVAPGYYAARVQTPPRRKEHVGIPTGWRPVVLVPVASDAATPVDERASRGWVDGSHPRVLGLVRPGPEGPPGTEVAAAPLVEQALPRSGGALVLRSGQLPPPDL